MTMGLFGEVGGYVNLHEHVNFGGAQWTFWADWGTIRDFTRVYCWLWFCTNINDRVSSVDVNINYKDGTIPQQAFVVLFQDVQLGGASINLHSTTVTPAGPGMFDDLGLFGFNDLASSMRYV